MVEAIVSFAIERIADVLASEVSLLRGVRDEVEQLQTKLRGIRCFLKDADSKQDQDDLVRNWVAEIRDIAYEAEDVIDTFLLLRAEKGSRKRVCGLIKKTTSMFTKVPNLHEIGTQIKSIQVKIESVSANRQQLGIKLGAEREGSKSRSEMQTRLRRAFPHDQEDDVISLEATIRDVKSQLLMMEEQRRVVALVGMGGLGKTTLAKKIYNDIHVRQHFDCHSWSFLSQQFSTRDVLVGILKKVASKQDKSELVKPEEDQSTLERVEAKFNSTVEAMREEELVETLFKVLNSKRYLVVLDDIWKNVAWDSLKHAFPSNGKGGSKVLLTTRNKEVASYADPLSSPVEPPLLTNDEAWELLSRKAFPKAILIKHGYSPRHEELGREMVKKCGGLPLAVVVLGGLLATKKTLMEWEAVHRNINARFVKREQNHPYGGVYGILALSYLDMPFYLKPFFLYFSQFPEDWEIHKRVLIRMWIAEGFVPRVERGREETMEDVGEQYLEELVDRCMIQVSQRDHTGIGIKTCRVHDLMRDMCILKAREENFLGIFEHYGEHTTEDSWSSSSSTPHLPASKSRRIAIHPQISRHEQNKMEFYTPRSKIGLENLRSLNIFVGDTNYGMTEEQAIFIFKNFRLLRVLILDGVQQYLRRLPEEIHNLIHLRYLGLRNTGVGNTGLKGEKKYFSLPASIGNLKKLHTLDLRNNGYFTRLPDVLWKLTRLRHLLVDDDRDYEHIRLHTLGHLETLKSVYAKNLIREGAMQKLTNLRNIGIYFQETEEVGAVLNFSIFGWDRLRSLKMRILVSFSNLEPLARCRQLTKLELGGAIPEYHNLGNLPQNLVKLILWGSELKQDPMCILEKLQHLRFLSLENNVYEGSKMFCSATGFPQLETLTLKSFGLEQWEIEEGAMPCLKSLSLSLEKLKMIPEGLRFLTTVRELKLIHMVTCEERVRVVNGVEGEDFDKVRHIPSISFN